METNRSPIEYIARWNLPGCLPEADPARFDSFEDAHEYLIEQVERCRDETEEDTEKGRRWDAFLENVQAIEGPGDVVTSPAPDGYLYVIASETLGHYPADEITEDKDKGEPMAWQGPGSIEPGPIYNTDGIGAAIGALVSDCEGLSRFGQSWEGLVFHGPVQDDEYPDPCDASFRVWYDDERDSVRVEGLDPAACAWLAEAWEGGAS